MLHNKYVQGALIKNNKFVWVGDNAIVAVGSTQLIDGTDDNQPSGTKVIGNLVHEVGVFGMHVCTYVQSLACEMELTGNIFSLMEHLLGSILMMDLMVHMEIFSCNNLVSHLVATRLKIP